MLKGPSKSSSKTIARPPSSAATVSTLTKVLAIRARRPRLKPSRIRITSKTGRLVTAATRPHISA
jgi:hypothetical protein